MAQTTQVQEKQPVKVVVSEVLKMLDQGIDRRGIAKHYGLSLADVKRIFNNTPSLKNKRVKPTSGIIEVVDDTVAEATPVTTTVVAEAAPVAEQADLAQAQAPAQPVQEAPAAQPAPQAATQETKGVW